ncbi:type II toxin-antitoxin system SpoIISA family toxin [Paenibacillus polymyxa]|uniref:Uncharacterized protein n=1 Tax=Paenibacillus polymyxa (strain SC2) TaxID=886882 RepID=E3EKM2_PAEPS|nr:type II toxin-antitoxin system SpoIISA family toxin [Paenibacillus polymyxa]ADO59854.1 hypothetical protein PPSC2_25920 [Paenibacillus polymyxa SC2]WPQ59916.1 type II toxin-antitoxin system SpoIISA family toxin [Paenibacillus polymyxa]
MYYFGWLVIGFFAIVGLASISHWANPVWYANNLINIRKTSYSLFILMYGGMILAGHIHLKDWGMAVQFASIAIFIDLAVLETPSILKIGNAEFKKNDMEIEKTIKDNQKTILQSFQKSEQFTDVVQYTSNHFYPLDSDNFIEWDLYMEQLKKYLRLYTDTFHFKLSITQFTYKEDIEQREQNIEGSLVQIERFHSINIKDKAELAGTLAKANVSVIKEQEIIGVPFFGNRFSYIVTLEANAQESVINAIDAYHIVNLLTVFEWFAES